MTSSDAWLIEFNPDFAIALGDHAMVELVQGSSTFPIPGAPKHCSSVCVWQTKILPIMDLRTILGMQPGAETESNYLCVIRYRLSHDRPVQQFALRVHKAPERILVDDEQACAVPEVFQSSPLDEVIISCFEHNDRPVLIPDINKLCSTEFLHRAIAA